MGERPPRGDRGLKKEKKDSEQQLPPIHIEFLGMRAEQQDAGYVGEFKDENGNPVTIGLIADGHGKEGAVMSQLTVDEIRKNIEAEARVAGAVDLADRETVVRCIEQVRPGLERHPDARDNGTTITLAVRHNDRIAIAYVGDSEAGVLKKQAAITSLTPAHRYDNTAEKKRTDRLVKAYNRSAGLHDGQAIVFQRSTGEFMVGIHQGGKLEGINVTRSLGDKRFGSLVSSEPEYVKYTITSDDRFLVVASDGFWNVMRKEKYREQEFARILERAPDAQKAHADIQRLLETWFLPDNIELIIIDLRSGAKKIPGKGMSRANLHSYE